MNPASRAIQALGTSGANFLGLVENQEDLRSRPAKECRRLVARMDSAASNRFRRCTVEDMEGTVEIQEEEEVRIVPRDR